MNEARDEPVSRAAAMFLIGLLVLCPALCGADEDRCASALAAQGDAGPPAHGPDEGDNCICQGAVPAHAVRLAHPEVASSVPFPAVANRAPLHAIAHLTRDGSPTATTGPGGHPAIRALLQNYRC